MKESVYLDTSIPSFFYETRKDAESVFKKLVTVSWWNSERDNYNVFVSELVLEELRRGRYSHKSDAIELISYIPILSITPGVERIAAAYLKHKLMPKKDISDAFHLAFASYYRIDYLLTWNCNHLANANKKKHIFVLNNRLKLHTPEIITPEQLFRERSE